MLKIKLQRIGKKNQGSFRIVVAEAKSKLNGEFIDLIGHYRPAAKPKKLVLSESKYREWVKKGACPTETIARLVARHYGKTA